MIRHSCAARVIPALLASFLRKQESSEKTFLIRSFVYWIPAFAEPAPAEAGE